MITAILAILFPWFVVMHADSLTRIKFDDFAKRHISIYVYLYVSVVISYVAVMATFPIIMIVNMR